MTNKLKEFHDEVVEHMKNGDGVKLDELNDKLDALADKYVARTTPVAFSIPVSAWHKNNSETSEFVYYADINVSGLTVNDYAEVNFTRGSQSLATEANICASGETMTGKIRIYAENIPTATISGEYLVTKGAV